MPSAITCLKQRGGDYAMFEGFEISQRRLSKPPQKGPNSLATPENCLQ